MPYQLMKFALSKEYKEPRMFRTPDRLKPRYDVVIIGAGGHGLAAAYYLARDHKITNVAVLEQSYLGSGGTGRNTAIVRSNYLTPEGCSVLRRESSALPGPFRRSRYQLVLFGTRPLYAGAHRCDVAHHALASGGQ